MGGLNEEERDAAVADIEALRKEAAALRAKLGDRLETMDFEVRPYTYGEKLEARRAAQKWENGQPTTFDQEEYGVRLLAASLGKTREDVLAMDAALVPALWREVAPCWFNRMVWRA